MICGSRGSKSRLVKAAGAVPSGQMKSRVGQRQREEESRREKIREEKESEERRCRRAKR